MTNKTADLRLPSLDGWRAISILLVLIQHSTVMPGWPKMLQNFLFSSIGGVGVRFFFVISGFLITWLLINEISQSGRISLKAFYIRRFLRILPVFLAFLLVVYSLTPFSDLHVGLKQYLVAGTFMADLWRISIPLGHLWSLGVEEKFYLFWPLLFILLYRPDFKSLKVLLVVLILVCPLSRIIVDLYKLDKHIFLLNDKSFFIIYDGLAIGCLGAIFWKGSQAAIVSFCRKWHVLVLVSGAIFCVLPAIFWIVPQLGLLKPFQDTLQCSGFLLLMLHSISEPTYLPYRMLNVKPVAHLGVISYSIYIWMGIAELSHHHFGLPSNILDGFPGWIFVVILLSELSYHFIEFPLMKKKKAVVAWFSKVSTDERPEGIQANAGPKR